MPIPQESFAHSAFKYSRDYLVSVFSDRGSPVPTVPQRPKQDLARDQQLIARTGKHFVTVGLALLALAFLLIVPAVGGPDVMQTFVDFLFAAGLIIPYLARAASNEPWKFQFDYWRDVWEHEPVASTFGRALWLTPLRTLSSLALWFTGGLVASIIELDLGTQIQAGRHPFDAVTAVSSVIVVFGSNLAFVYLCMQAFLVPLRLRRLHRADAELVKRYNIAPTPLPRLLVRGIVNLLATGLVLDYLIGDWLAL